MALQRRQSRSWLETQKHVREAKLLVERCLSKVYSTESAPQPPDFDQLLDQIK